MTPSSSLTSDDILASARRTFDTEIAGLNALALRLNSSFVQAVQLILACQGRWS